MIKNIIINDQAMVKYIKNIDMSFEFIMSMIEDIQDLAKFGNNQNFTLNNEFFNVRSFIDDVGVLFEE